jgi:alpha-beta hydrolase superfamily lysophospholipase
MSQTTTPATGTAAGVPFLAFPPAPGTAPAAAPMIVAWHLMDPPRSEAAFAAAVPMKDLPAWRIYLGLPLCGARLPQGNPEALMRLFYEDAVLKGYQPIAQQGAAEFPAALTEIRRQLGLGGPLGPLGLVGGSMGSAIAQLVLTETAPAAGIKIAAAVLLSPIAQLHPMVGAIGRRYNVTYPWSEAALRFAERLDFVARASDFVRAGQPAVRLIVGANDDRDGFIEPVKRLHSALAERYSDPTRVDLIVVPGMAHALAEEPGIAPAPQTPHAAAVDQHTTAWFRAHLRGCTT